MKNIKHYVLLGLLLILVSAIMAKSAITEIAGLAVAQTTSTWNNIRDGAAGDNLTNGVIASQIYVYDSAGGNFDRLRGTTASGLDVNLTNGTVTVIQPTAANLNATVTIVPATGTFYAIKKTNLTTASANLAFGFTSKKLIIETPATNTDEICIDWGGGTAACPAADTAGDDRIPAGRIITLDTHAVTSISAIAASGTQTIFVRAW